MAVFAKEWVLRCSILIGILLVTTTNARMINALFSTPGDCQRNCTNNNVGRMEACQKGCRLYSICQWAVEPENATLTLRECHSACSEAYENQDMSQACQNGCNFFKSSYEASETDASNLMQGDDNFFGNFNSDMFDYAGIVMNDFINSAWQSMSMMQSFMPSVVETEIIEISDGNHHEIIVIQHQPEINTEHPNKKLIINTESDKSKSTVKENIETNLQTNANRPRSFGEFSLYRRDDDPAPTDTGFDRYWKKIHKSWWSCFTKKQGLPELVFTLFWISTFLLLILSCCIQFAPKSQLSVNGDLAFIRDSDGKLPSYMKTYPAPEGAKVSPYFSASVVACQDKKPLLDAQQY